MFLTDSQSEAATAQRTKDGCFLQVHVAVTGAEPEDEAPLLPPPEVGDPTPAGMERASGHGALDHGIVDPSVERRVFELHEDLA